MIVYFMDESIFEWFRFLWMIVYFSVSLRLGPRTL